MKKVPAQGGFSDCIFSEAYVVVWESQEEFEKRKATELLECDIFIGSTVLQVKSVAKHQINAAHIKGNCVQFLKD